MIIIVVVDANILISALLGGKPHRILFDSRFQFITTERTTWEVKRYIPLLAKKLGLAELEILSAFESLPITFFLLFLLIKLFFLKEKFAYSISVTMLYRTTTESAYIDSRS
jgi:hypothetical protein